MATSSGAISSTGIGSGLDVTTIISKLMSVEQAPLTKLQEQATSLNSKISILGQLQNGFSAMRDKANALVSPSLWSATTATSSDTAGLRVSSSSTAAAGSYEVKTQQLASSQTLASQTFSSSTATLGTGTMTIELGTWASDNGFTAKADTSAVSITIGEGETSLEKIRDKINAAGAGVTASLINDAKGARLTLRSSTTGEENGFRVSVSGAGAAGTAGVGLEALAWSPDTDNTSGTGMGRTSSAANASALINGIAVSSASNTLSDVVPGLSMTLTKVSDTPVTVEVTSNTDAVKTAITDFVTAFNSLSSSIRTQTAYNADTKTGGPLQGDQGTLSLQSQLRGVLNQSSTASSSYSRLSDIGISMKSDGSLEVNTTKLTNALSVGNLEQTKKLLTTDGDTNEATGFVRRFKKLGDAALSAAGVFDTRKTSMNAQLTRNSKAQDAQELRLQNIETRLKAQYTSLDTTMAKLTTLSTYVSQQIAAMNSSS